MYLLVNYLFPTINQLTFRLGRGALIFGHNTAIFGFLVGFFIFSSNTKNIYTKILISSYRNGLWDSGLLMVNYGKFRQFLLSAAKQICCFLIFDFLIFLWVFGFWWWGVSILFSNWLFCYLPQHI